MGNFFDSGPKYLKLIVRVRIYHILIYIKEKIVGLKTGSDFGIHAAFVVPSWLSTSPKP